MGWGCPRSSLRHTPPAPNLPSDRGAHVSCSEKPGVSCGAMAALELVRVLLLLGERSKCC